MNQFHVIADFLRERPTKRRQISIPEFSESLIISAGKYRGAKFQLNRAPYMIEPLQCMSPESNIQEVRLQWPAQVGKSTVGEIVILYYTAVLPSEIMYVSSNELQAEKFMRRRIEPAARAQGIIFRSQSDNKGSRQTGSTAYAKEFPGGNIDAVSALSASSLASSTKRVIIADEVSRYKAELSEGSTWDIMHARSQQWGAEKKVLAISTPVLSGSCLIEQLYDEGDCRQFFVPCPFCGHMQLLDFFQGRGYGLHWETVKGKIDKKTIGVLCEKCGKKIPEKYKHVMLNGGEWRASVTAINEHTASFHINGLYSPFLSWDEMAAAHASAEENPTKRQSFINLKMGLPFKETGARPKVEKLINNNKGFYKSGTVPKNIVYLTIGCDVQRGSTTDPEKPARIEMTVAGIGTGHRTSIIEHRVFKGAIDDPYSGAFEALQEYANSTGFLYERIEDKRKFQPSIILIDSGDGVYYDAVYRFCQGWRNTFPSKGFTLLKKRKHEDKDELSASNFKRYRLAKMNDDTQLMEVSTHHYKNFIYTNLNIERVPGDEQKFGFIEFPADVTDNYLNQVIAEERLADGSFQSKGRAVEALDCLVLCLAGADAFLEMETDYWRAEARARGCNAVQMSSITRRAIIDRMAQETKMVL
ncbi:MAG TPA: phage terminase large subunit family protein [Spirochaetota bacterium]|nr:phage terminase large subunit family protein [Spirochaetota bacterium]